MRALHTIDSSLARDALVLQGDKIYAGFERKVCVFDASRPGRDCEHRATVKTKKSAGGQRGILSCIAFNPDFSGWVPRHLHSR